MLAGLLAPAAGRIALSGGGEGETLAERCHLVGHLNGVKRSFTAAENVRFWAGYLGGQGDPGTCLARLGLAALADIPASLFSAGQSRRLALARLLAAPRPLWLLDEPSVSLDAASRDLLASLIEEHLAGGGLVVAATHMDLGVGFKARLALGAGQPS
jgi:heme exporter protein A